MRLTVSGMLRAAEPHVMSAPRQKRWPILKSLRRRMDDALCAFLHGHSRRDLRRVRLRRLQLLAGRVIVRRHEEAGMGIFPEHHLEVAQAILGLRNQLLQDAKGLVAGALVQRLEIERCGLRSARISGWSEIGPLNRAAAEVGDLLHALPVFSDIGHGKLYEGLLQRGVRDALQDHLLRLRQLGLRLIVRWRHRRPPSPAERQARLLHIAVLHRQNVETRRYCTELAATREVYHA